MKNHNNKNRLKRLIYLILAGFLIKLFRFIFKGDNEKKIWGNFKDFFRKEKKEIKELVNGEESFKEYCEDSSSIFKNYFIPDDCNDFKPKILRTKPLAIIVIALLLLKVSVTGYLFFIYPNLARMSQAIQDEIHSLINIERSGNSVDKLVVNDKLNEAAKKKAEDMINKNYFAHKSPDGEMIWDMINRDEYPYLYVGENLAMNFTSAQSAHKALMLSPTHKKNILNSKYTEIGVAVVSGEIDNKKTNVLVQVFAYPKSVKPALAMETAPKKETAPPAADKPAEKEIPVESAVEIESVPAKIVKTESATEPAPNKSKVLSVENSQAADLKNIKVVPRENIENQKQDIAAEKSNEAEVYALASAKPVSVEIKNSAEAKIINYSQYIFIGALIFLILMLLVNILVRASIQHKPVIVQTLLVIFFIYGMMTVKFHFLEYITEKILVM